MFGDFLEHSVLKHDRFDELLFERVMKFDHPIINKINEEENTHQSSALFDMFGSFYKTMPEVSEQFQDTHCGQLLQELMDTKEYRELRPLTTLDDFASAVASFKFVPTLAEEEKKLQKLLDVGGDTNLDSDDEVRYTLRQALQETKDFTDKILNALRGLGFSSNSLYKETQLGMSTDNLLSIADKLSKNPDFLDVAELAGKMQFLVRKCQKEKVRRGVGSVIGVEIGAELQRLLPIEFIRLRHPKLKNVFFKDLFERNLQQYQLEEKEPFGKGPIVVCFDVSGSMIGKKLTWAKAVTLALMNIAKSQKRAMYVIPFNNNLRGPFIVNHTIKQIENFIAICASGGTNFQVPLNAAYTFISEHKDQTFKAADVIFITDGQYKLHDSGIDELNKNKKKAKASTYSFLIDYVDYVSQYDTLDRLSDELFKINSTYLSSETDGLETVFSI